VQSALFKNAKAANLTANFDIEVKDLATGESTLLDVEGT
jgi:hypothetical protein